MYTFGQLKSDLRQIIFPAGEADNLVLAHDKMFVDAIVECQRVVKCLQRDNTDLHPHCSTLYNCGMTVFDAPRADQLLSLSVIDKLDPDTGEEDADAEDDWCSEIFYRRVAYCYVQAYITSGRSRGCCLPAAYFFAIPGCSKSMFPVPTDADVAEGLPVLPLGYHYPQTSTDRTYGRSPSGVWAVDRGKIFVAPWIQSTETVIVRWDGIKRRWTDADIVDEDPQLSLAIEEYVRWKHAGRFDASPGESVRAEGAFREALHMLWHDCEKENRMANCGPSKARASSLLSGTLYFNESQTAIANCADGTTGDPVSVTIPAGTVGSNISVADANQIAAEQARTQAEAQLVCTTTPTTYWNTAQTATASCEVEVGAPAPIGNPITVTVAANLYSSTVSQVAADQLASAAALAQAQAQLSCTYGNAAQTATCQSDPSITRTVAANTYQSTISQEDADYQAMAEAQNLVNQDPGCIGGAVVWNTSQECVAAILGCGAVGQPGGGITRANVTVTVPAALFSGVDQNAANAAARAAGQSRANVIAGQRSTARQCTSYACTYPC